MSIKTFALLLLSLLMIELMWPFYYKLQKSSVPNVRHSPMFDVEPCAYLEVNHSTMGIFRANSSCKRTVSSCSMEYAFRFGRVMIYSKTKYLLIHTVFPKFHVNRSPQYRLSRCFPYVARV